MEQKKKIGLICAVHGECEDILASVRNKRIVTVGTATYISGYVNEIRVTIGITGIGKVNAAYGCGMMIRGYAPHSLVNFGIGGCYPDSKLSIGDVAVAQKEIYADEGVRDESGFQGMEAIGIPIIESGGTSVYNELAADTLLIKQVKKASRDVHCNIAFGTFLTVSSVSGSLKRSKELEHNFGGICENMEGAAVFHVALMHGIPCIEVRGISNIAGVREKRSWDIGVASRNCQAVVRAFIDGSEEY